MYMWNTTIPQNAVEVEPWYDGVCMCKYNKENKKAEYLLHLLAHHLVDTYCKSGVRFCAFSFLPHP